MSFHPCPEQKRPPQAPPRATICHCGGPPLQGPGPQAICFANWKVCDPRPAVCLLWEAEYIPAWPPPSVDDIVLGKVFVNTKQIKHLPAMIHFTRTPRAHHREPVGCCGDSSLMMGNCLLPALPKSGVHSGAPCALPRKAVSPAGSFYLPWAVEQISFRGHLSTSLPSASWL